MSRADIFVVTPVIIIGVEIKSDADTYTRLSGQIKDYDKFFDRNYVVCGGSHGNHIKEHVPDYWGIITVDETDKGCDFYVLREAMQNPKMRLSNQLSLLWRPELAKLQENLNLPKYAGLGKAKLVNRLSELITKEIAGREICKALLERDYTTIGSRIDEYRKEKNLKKRKSSAKLGVKRKRRSSKKIK